MTRRVLAVTGSRAEYGLLSAILDALASAPDVELALAVTGAHLAAHQGLTVREVEARHTVHARVDMQLSDDSPPGIARSMGLAVAGFGEAIARLAPDYLLVLGDRYEILAAAQAALVARIPVIHLMGGELTYGAWDESIRHALTKLAHVHLVAHEDAARRVRQLGEDPARVHVVGSPGLEAVRRLEPPDRPALERALGHPLAAQNLLVTYHPETLAGTTPVAQLDEMLAALDALGPTVGVIFTSPNADAGGQALAARLDGWAADRPHVHRHASLGHRRYLEAMAVADAVVGNSSSGLIEAPSLGCPTVNIGGRQDGRLRAASVIDCPAERSAVEAALRQALTRPRAPVENPYGDGRTSARVLEIVRALPPPEDLLRKRFFDV